MLSRNASKVIRLVGGDVCNKEVVSEEMNEQRSGGSKRVSFMNILEIILERRERTYIQEEPAHFLR